MRTRFRAAAVALVLVGLSIGVWRAFADRGTTAGPIDCNVGAPLPPCAGGPPPSITAHDLLMGGEPELASAKVDDGTLARIRFAPTAAVADITEFLVANSISVVDGPKLGGMYTVRLPETGSKKADLIKRIAVETSIVDFIATVQ
jgi:hypothetical protein